MWLTLPLAHAGASTAALQGPNRVGFTNTAANFETGREKPEESGYPAGDGKTWPADRSGEFFHRQGIG